MGRETLRCILPPGEDRPPLQVAKELVELYRTEYSLTVGKLCDLFCCERQWAQDFILGNVRHIYITQYFRKYILDTLGSSMTGPERHDFTYSFYFVSCKDLARFYRETATARQKTRLADIGLYRKLSSDFNGLMEEKSTHAGMRPCKGERLRHLKKMEELLSPQGYEIYVQSLEGKFEWTDAVLPDLALHPKSQAGRLFSTAEYAKKVGFGPNTAYKQLCRQGAVQVRFGGKTLWQLPDYGGAWLIPVQA